MNQQKPDALAALKQQMATLLKYNREQRQKREREIQLPLAKIRR